MRLFLFISTIFIAIASLSAQNTVKVTDPNFEACLIEDYSSLIVNGELDTTLAKAFTGRLDCNSRGIKSIPELEYFDNLTELNFSQNALTSFPPVNHMKQLTYFYTAENQLTSLPNMDSLKLLEQLICWKNQLTALPDIDHMDNLFRLDVPVNKLTTFPVLSPVAPMRTLLVDDNFITDLPDLSGYPDLQIVKVVNNQMSFDDLDKILTQPDPSIYDYYPQKFFDVLPSQVIDEGDSLFLVNPNDQNNTNALVQWMKNGQFLTYEGDSLLLYPATLEDNGKYVAITTSTLFPNKPLYTNLTTIKVNECPDLELVSYTLTDAQCTTPGQVLVQTTVPDYSFELIGNTTYVPNENNYFEGIEAGTYSLTVKHPSGCERHIDGLAIASEACEEVIITPDDDGYQDTFYFDYTGTGVLYDKFGNKITELTLPTLWDAKVDHQKVNPGYYTLDVNQGATQVGVTVVY